MTEKVTVINRLVVSDETYTVDVDGVEKIVFFSTLEPYNKNKCYEGPCYVIYYNDNGARHIIPAKEAKGIEVIYVDKDAIKKKKTTLEAFAYETATKAEGK